MKFQFEYDASWSAEFWFKGSIGSNAFYRLVVRFYPLIYKRLSDNYDLLYLSKLSNNSLKFYNQETNNIGKTYF